MLLEEGVPSLMRPLPVASTCRTSLPPRAAGHPRPRLRRGSGARDPPGPEHREEPVQRDDARAAPWVRALAAALAVLIVALVAAGVYAALFG